MRGPIDPRVRDSWLKLTTPEVLSSNLIRAALFLVAWELLKSSLVGKLRAFFSTEYQDGEWKVSDAYKTNVLARHKNALTASCLWFKEMGALTDDDLRKLEEAREYRNAIAHNLPEFLGSFDRNIEDDQLTRVQELLVKVDRWWIREIELDTDPDYAGQEIPDEEISSGNMLMLSLIFDVLAGDHSYRDHLMQLSGEAAHGEATARRAANPGPPADR